MIIKNLSEIKNTTLPIIIIGSGPAGISTAIKLEKNKVKSLILEAGDIYYNKNSAEYLKGSVVGDKYPDLSNHTCFIPFLIAFSAIFFPTKEANSVLLTLALAAYVFSMHFI